MKSLRCFGVFFFLLEEKDAVGELWSNLGRSLWVVLLLKSCDAGFCFNDTLNELVADQQYFSLIHQLL